MKPKVVYIAGYGRSGSTLLDVLLGAHRRVCSLGELGFLWDEINKANFGCACGSEIRDCPWWSVIAGDIERVWPSGKIASRSKFAEHWLFGILGGFGYWSSTFNDANKMLFNHLLAPGNCDILVDSSKTAYRFGWRPIALHRGTGIDVRVVHLVRNPRDVVRSCLKGRNDRLHQGIVDLRKLEVSITLFGWFLSNVLALLNGRILGSSRYMRVDFDDLREHPETILNKVGSFIGVDLSDVVDQVNNGAPFAPGHMVAGNRMARQPEVRVIRGGLGDGPPLNRLQKFATAIPCGLLYKILTVKLRLDRTE